MPHNEYGNFTEESAFDLFGIWLVATIALGAIFSLVIGLARIISGWPPNLWKAWGLCFVVAAVLAFVLAGRDD